MKVSKPRRLPISDNGRILVSNFIFVIPAEFCVRLTGAQAFIVSNDVTLPL